jgi:hypothetical protein
MKAAFMLPTDITVAKKYAVEGGKLPITLPGGSYDAL